MKAAQEFNNEHFITMLLCSILVQPADVTGVNRHSNILVKCCMITSDSPITSLNESDHIIEHYYTVWAALVLNLGYFVLSSSIKQNGP